MKTSNSEQMFIDTLRALGLTTDLCEAVNGMRKAVMEAEEAESGEDANKFLLDELIDLDDIPVDAIETKSELIEHHLGELHEKLKEKLNSLEEKLDKLEETDQKDKNTNDEIEKVNNDIKAISDYYSQHFPKVWVSGKDANEWIRFIESHKETTSDDIIKLFEKLFKAHDDIWKGMKSHHRVSVPVSERARNHTAKLIYKGYSDIDLDELIARVPRSDERDFIQSVIDKIDDGKKPERGELRKVYDIQKVVDEEAPIWDNIKNLEIKLKNVSPEAYIEYEKLMDSANYNIRIIKSSMFKKLLDSLKGQEAGDILEKIMKQMTETGLYGGEGTAEYIQLRDELDTGAARGKAVNRGDVAINNISYTKSFSTGNRVQDNDPENAKRHDYNNTRRRESKTWAERRISDINDYEEKAMNKLNASKEYSSNKIDSALDFVIDITENGTEANAAANDLKNYVIGAGEIDNDKINEYIENIVDCIKKGEIKDENVIDVTLYDILDSVKVMYPKCDMADATDIKTYLDDFQDNIKIIPFGRTVGEDAEAYYVVRDAMKDAIRIANERKYGDETKEVSKRSIFKCFMTISKIIKGRVGNNRYDDTAKIVKDVLGKLPEMIDMKTRYADKVNAGKNRANYRNEIKEIINDPERKNGIVIKTDSGESVEYHINTNDGDDKIIAKRFGQAFDNVEYGSVQFSYDGEGYGLWTARNFSKEVSHYKSSWEKNNKLFFGNQNPVKGEGSGWLYTYDQAEEICPEGWHIPTVNEWKALLNDYLGKVIKDSPANAGIYPNEGALLLKSRYLRGLDCFDFGIYPGGAIDAVSEHHRGDPNRVVYYWCGGVEGMRCVKFDIASTIAEIVPVDPGFGHTACLRFVSGPAPKQQDSKK